MNFTLWQDGQEYGPFDLDSVEASIASGDLSPETLARIEEGSDWKPLETLLAELKRRAAEIKLEDTAVTKSLSFYIWHKGEKRGPYDEDFLIELILKGEIAKQIPALNHVGGCYTSWTPLFTLMSKTLPPPSNTEPQTKLAYPEPPPQSLHAPLTDSEIVQEQTQGLPQQVSHSLASIRRPTAKLIYKCPQCSNEQIKKASQVCAPPERKGLEMMLEPSFSYICKTTALALVIPLLFFHDVESAFKFGAFCEAAALFIGIFILLEKAAANDTIRKYNDDIYPERLAEWKRNWCCQRCGYLGPLKEERSK